MKRDEIKAEDKWVLEDIYKSDDAFLTVFNGMQAQVDELVTYEGKVISSADVLFEFLTKLDAFNIEIGKLYLYSHEKLHQDLGNSTYQDLSQKVEAFCATSSSQLAFIDPELATLTPEILDKYYKENDKLVPYTRFFNEILREKEHVLDSATESILAEVSDIANVADNTFSMLNNVDIKFPDVKDSEGNNVPLTHGTYILLLENKDRELRKNAFKGLYGEYDKLKNTIASLFAGNVKSTSFFAKMRKYDSALSMTLSANNIPLDVYHNLIKTVNDNISVLHDYMTLRKNALGLNELHMYDLFVPIVKDYDKKITFDEAKDTVIKALSPLGEDYVNIVKSAFTDGWIDKYENEGKRTGAYSWGTYGIPHPYLLLNHNDNLNSMFTLAHEMGHALHSYHSNKYQSSTYADYCIFVAEVASTVNEALLMQYLLKTTTDKTEKEYLLNYFMEQFKSTLYRQTMFAEFELAMYDAYAEGTTLTAEYISDVYYNLVKKYHGESVTVDEDIALEWSRIPHFYTPFYVYQYSTGYSAAIAISTRILKEGEPAVKDYIKFLSGGCSQDPIDLLKIAGVDMSSPKPIQDAIDTFAGVIEEFKQTL